MSNETIYDRRDFLKSVAKIGGMGLLLSSCPWLYSYSSQVENEIRKEKLNLAVIGTGSRGQFHLAYLKEFPNVNVIALCDVYDTNLDAASILFPKAKRVKDYQKVLEMKDVDAVLIATPLHLHAAMTIDSLNMGKHVFCEKSLARTSEDCLKVYNTYKKSGKVLYIGQQRLFDEKYIKAMGMIHAGALGTIGSIRSYWFRNNDWRRAVPSPDMERFVNWRLYKEYSAGLLTELATHQLQVGNWALKMIPESVAGFGDIIHWKDGREVYDNVNLIYRYPNGVNMSYESMISNKRYGLEEEILGSKGTMEPEKGRYFFEEATPAPGIMQLINQIENKVFDNVSFANPSWVPETASINKAHYLIDGVKGHDGSSSVGAADDGTFQLLKAFCNSAIIGKPVEVLVEEAYYSSVLALLGEQAIEEGRVIKFPEELKIPYLS